MREPLVVEPVNTGEVFAGGRVEFRSAFGYDVDAASAASGLDCSVLPSRTQQHFAEEVDINTIVRRFGLTGELPADVPQVLQGDFTNVVDFQSAMDLIVAARESFMEQPAEVRARFDNDPQKFLSFTSDRANLDEAIRLGLVRSESVQARATEVAAARKAEIDAAVALELAAREKAAGAATGPVST